MAVKQEKFLKKILDQAQGLNVPVKLDKAFFEKVQSNDSEAFQELLSLS